MARGRVAQRLTKANLEPLLLATKITNLDFGKKFRECQVSHDRDPMSFAHFYR